MRGTMQSQSRRYLIRSCIALAFCLAVTGCRQSKESDIQHFEESIRLYQQALAVEEPQRDGRILSTISKEDFEECRRLRKLSLEEAEKVNVKSLSVFDAEMPEKYEEFFRQPLRDWLRGEEVDDFWLINSANFRMNSFGEYYRSVQVRNRERKK